MKTTYNNQNKIYKTTISTINKYQPVIDVNPPDNQHEWELAFTNFKKNKAFYTWFRVANLPSFSSSEEAFQKSLEMVKNSTESYGEVTISEKG